MQPGVPRKSESKPPSSADASELFEADEIYRQLGIFVVGFQYVESKLVEICWLLTQPPYADGERQLLADLPYAKLVRETRRRIAAFLARRELDRPKFSQRSECVLDECRDLGYLRNRIVHSAFIHLEAGGELRGIVRANMKRHGPDDSADDVEFLGPDSFAESLAGLGGTAFSLGQLQVQLIHWTP